MNSPLKKRVLCIDRDSVALSIRTAILKTGGFDAIGESSLDRAQILARGERIDVVVLDDNTFATANGELSHIVEALPPLPILVLSSSPWADKRVDGHDRLRRFSKSDGPEAFLAAVRECIHGLENTDTKGSAA